MRGPFLFGQSLPAPTIRSDRHAGHDGGAQALALPELGGASLEGPTRGVWEPKGFILLMAQKQSPCKKCGKPHEEPRGDIA